VKTVHEVTWGDIDAGALVVDGTGQHWRVTQKRVKLPEIAFLIGHDDVAQWVVRGYSDPVVLVDETAGRAVETVMSVLGGVLNVEPLPNGPDKPNIRALYRAHLFHIHQLSVPPSSDVTGGTLAELQKLHAIAHAGLEPGGIPHTHSLGG